MVNISKVKDTGKDESLKAGVPDCGPLKSPNSLLGFSVTPLPGSATAEAGLSNLLILRKNDPQNSSR